MTPKYFILATLLALVHGTIVPYPPPLIGSSWTNDNFCQGVITIRPTLRATKNTIEFDNETVRSGNELFCGEHIVLKFCAYKAPRIILFKGGTATGSNAKCRTFGSETIKVWQTMKFASAFNKLLRGAFAIEESDCKGDKNPLNQQVKFIIGTLYAVAFKFRVRVQL